MFKTMFKSPSTILEEGGPYFPNASRESLEPASGWEGITFRDACAIAALPALVTEAWKNNKDRGAGDFHFVDMDEIAGKAYALANAMVKRRLEP